MTIFILALCELFKTKQKTFKDINLFIMKSSQNKKTRNSLLLFRET